MFARLYSSVIYNNAILIALVIIALTVLNGVRKIAVARRKRRAMKRQEARIPDLRRHLIHRLSVCLFFERSKVSKFQFTATLDSGEEIAIGGTDIDDEQLQKFIRGVTMLFNRTPQRGMAVHPVSMEEVRNLRKSKQWTQKELGDFLEVSTTQVSMMENGERQPSHIVNEKLKKFLEIV